MYSPKISEEHVRKLYRIAKHKGIHMTTLVNELLHHVLDDLDEEAIHEPSAVHEVKQTMYKTKIRERNAHTLSES